MASKNVNAPVSTKLRLAKEDGEMYAKVTKLFGNGMAEILCNDKVVRLLIIRRRFKGRNKRDNMISYDFIYSYAFFFPPSRSLVGFPVMII